MKRAVLYFDGECNLCNGAVQFFIVRTSGKTLHFASLQGKAGEAMKSRLLPSQQGLDTIVLEINGEFYFKSSAALRACGYLRGFWPMMKVFLVFPGFIRNAVYDLVARNRIKWFGKADQCLMPKPEWKAQFLD
jgi:predicted DCC family thiol-disulfide oxidoreductase YuxK